MVAAHLSSATASADPPDTSHEPDTGGPVPVDATPDPKKAELPFALSANLGWHFGVVPHLVLPTHRGLDPEVRWGFRVGGKGQLIVAPGFRLSGYYLGDLRQFGLSAQVTVRFTVPLGNWAPYACLGLGTGAVVSSDSGVATLWRVGFAYHFSKRFAVGVDATYQTIEGTNFRFGALAPVVRLTR